MKHLVIDARYACPAVDGIHTYLRNIVPHITAAGVSTNAFRATLLVHPEMESFWRTATPESIIVPSSMRPMRPAQNWQLPQLLAGLRADLLFYPAWDPPLFVSTPFVFTIHDVTAFRMRPYFEQLDTAKRAYMRLIIKTGLRRARATFVVSNATRDDIGEHFGVKQLHKVRTIPHGITADTASVSSNPSAADCYLYVGCDRPHKNLERLVRAYAAARQRCADLPPLEMAGASRTPADLRRVIKQAGVADHVILHGHVSDAALEKLYSRALALVFPSLGEGFGLPILEAMIRGVPVITSNISGCAEVAGNAALTVDPYQVGDISAAMLRVFQDPACRSALVRDGRARASEFTWKRTAERTLAVIKESMS